jgi:hypothetical protein
MSIESPRIFYFCYRHNVPRGGQKHTYRHVDILNNNGLDAAAFHPGEGFRLTWFENDTRVLGYSEFMRSVDPASDFVVLPEDLGEAIVEFPGRKVIFNKNLFKGFECFGTREIAQYPYQCSEVIAAFTVSEHNQKQLQFAYPHLHIEKVDVEINPAVFSFCPPDAKQPLIACATKSPEMLMPIYHMIQSRSNGGLNRGKEFHWIFLDQMSERETASILHDAFIFIFLSAAEGIGRMPLEAMASGCMLLSYGYGPVDAVLPSPRRFEYGDPVSAVLFLEQLMAAYPRPKAEWIAEVERGRKIANRYSLDNQEVGVLNAWKRIMNHGVDHRIKQEVSEGVISQAQ